VHIRELDTITQSTFRCAIEKIILYIMVCNMLLIYRDRGNYVPPFPWTHTSATPSLPMKATYPVTAPLLCIANKYHPELGLCNGTGSGGLADQPLKSKSRVRVRIGPSVRGCSSFGKGK